jgi:hypothetical protein
MITGLCTKFVTGLLCFSLDKYWSLVPSNSDVDFTKHCLDHQLEFLSPYLMIPDFGSLLAIVLKHRTIIARRTTTGAETSSAASHRQPGAC